MQNQTYYNHTPAITHHAQARAQQRRFSATDIEYVMQHGQLIWRSGVRFYFLGQRDLPPADAKFNWAQRLVGATVLVSAEGECVITLYKNKNALKDIKRKTKYVR